MRRMMQWLSVVFCVFIVSCNGLQCAPVVTLPQVQLPGAFIPQFVDPLPVLDVAGGPMKTVITDANEVEVHAREFLVNVMPSSFVPASSPFYGGTWVWGYTVGSNPPPSPAGTYIGPVFITQRGLPTQVRFVNDLGFATTTNVAFWANATDQTIHWADPLGGQANACAHGIVAGQAPTGTCAAHYAGSIPMVPHLHGGEVPPVVDGGPDAWFTSDGTIHGNAYYTRPNVAANGNVSVYRYPNGQQAAMLWFHEHTLGVTRLNVYVGLAGGYILTDPGTPLPAGLHPAGLQQGAGGAVEYLTPLVIQDRMFDTNGQLFFPNQGINPEHPYWIPEFVGDTIVVNGKVWPFMAVQEKRYRFLIVNGSNARTYELFFPAGPTIWQIGTDGGYLDAPVSFDPSLGQKLLLMPGERADIIVNFAGFGNRTLVLNNTGATPYPGGDLPAPQTLGQIIQFRVAAGNVTDASFDPATGAALRPPMIRLVDPAAGTLASGVTAAKTRQLTLNEIAQDSPSTVNGINYPG
ncbi:MAG TPA: copper oxidase, partial [Phycisphaerae bacterium]|nr:copper oxidase [Phycisphaerae bacterium]